MQAIRGLCLATLVLCSSACGIYGSQPGREERAVAQAGERGFTQVGQHVVEGDRYVHMRVLLSDETNPCAGKLIVDMNHSKDDAGESTTILVRDTFLKPDGTAYRVVPKDVRDPIISEMNDDPELSTWFKK